MLCSRVRVTPFVLLVCGAAACRDSSSPPLAAPSASIDHATASLAVANATVHVIPALQNLSVAGINDTDEVAGNGPNGPFRWTQKAGLQYLTTKGTKGNATASSVSDNGAVGGYAQAGDSGYYHAVVWKADGSLRIFQGPADSTGGFSCVLSSINIFSQMVGNCVFIEGFSSPTLFEWHRPALLNPPGVPDGDQLFAISNDGWIAGGAVADVSNAEEGAFVVSPTGQLFKLLNHSGTLSINGWATAVTRHGFAAGVDVEGACGQAVAWLSHPGQTFPEFRMGTCGSANGITPDFYVVGTGTDSLNNPNTDWAFVWVPGRGLQRLPGLGGKGELSSAIGINANHHVLGQIQSGGVTHTVIWYVTPSSASLALRAPAAPGTR
jgi:hypothetical protein